MLHWRNQHLKILGILYWGSTYGSCKKQKYVTPWMILVGMHPSNHPQVRKRTSHCSQWPGDGVPSSSSEIAAILISNPIDCFFSFLERVSEVAQLCLTLWDPMGCSLPDSTIHGVFQARILEWVAISFSRRSSRPRDWTRVSGIVGRRFTIWATCFLSNTL